MVGQRPRQARTARAPPSRRSSLRSGSQLRADSFPVVGLGASAGDLDAFRRLLAALPTGTGMACILIQHLDPKHASMIVDLLTGHTPIKVQQAADGLPLKRENIYLIPPGAYLSFAAVPCGSRNRGNVTARACRSTSSCARWRTNSASARSA